MIPTCLNLLLPPFSHSSIQNPLFPAFFPTLLLKSHSSVFPTLPFNLIPLYFSTSPKPTLPSFHYLPFLHTLLFHPFPPFFFFTPSYKNPSFHFLSSFLSLRHFYTLFSSLYILSLPHPTTF
jgi:hypothetical protein